MYKRLDIEISLNSPLAIGTDGESTLYNETRTYIPGAALRGALAGTMLSVAAGEDFESLFGVQLPEPIFENLYPSRGGAQTFPIPLSARTCKYHQGFRSKGTECHGVGDILIRQAVFEAMLENRVNLPCLYEPRCPECHSDVTWLPGYYGTLMGEYERTTTPVQRISRTAIGRRRQVAADRLLYTLEMVEPGVRGQPPLLFRGTVICRETQEAILRRWLQQVQGIGGGRSRGLGDVEVRVLDGIDETFPTLRNRLEEFDGAVRREWAFYSRVAGVKPLPGDVRFFSVDLLAPAILTCHGLPATCPDLDELELPGESVTLWRAMSQQSVIGGWHMGGQLPRRTMLATDVGSAFMYRCKGLSFDDLEGALQALELKGVGEERVRGFGRVLISSPFHYQAEVTI